MAIEILVIIGSIMILAMVIITNLGNIYTLNRIKSKTVGDGQHGVASFMTQKEIDKSYEHILYDVKSWRKGENLPEKQGIIVGCSDKRDGMFGIVDTGDVHSAI